MSKTYQVCEVFYSLQGEGVRVGTPNVFVRFTGCNLRCAIEPGPKSPGGFDCDTEFESGRKVTLHELREWVAKAVGISIGREIPLEEWNHLSDIPEFRDTPCWLILTGGEPGLQVDREFCDYFHSNGCKLAIETNGTVQLPTYSDPKNPTSGNGGETELELHLANQIIDWITLSPKVAEHAVKQLWANEVKYVRGFGQAIPKPAATAEHYLISPAFDGYQVHKETLRWCNQLVLENPQWRLSTQQHKLLNIR